jgi:hypothetical protein
MDDCSFVSTNGGWNLAIGALTDTGRFRALSAEDGCPVVTGQVQQDRCWAKVGLNIIAENPLRWLQAMPAKLENTYNHESFAVAYLGEADPSTWPPARQLAGRLLMSLYHKLLLVFSTLAALGIVSFRRPTPATLLQASLLFGILAFSYFELQEINGPLFWLPVLAPLLACLHLPGTPRPSSLLAYLWALLAATTLTHAVFFGDDRYHLVVSAALCILAGAALRQADLSKPAPAPS